MDKRWHELALKYLAQLGDAEYRNHLAGKGKQGKYVPSEYHQDLIVLLGEDDEHEWKAIKNLRGQDSALGF